MFKNVYVVAAIAGFAFMSTAALAHAQDTTTPFVFSTALQTSFDAMEDAKASLRAKIDAAIEGLSRDEAQTVLATYADEVTALRDAERALRDEGVVEMEAAGVDLPERTKRDQDRDQDRDQADGRPERGGEGGQGRHSN